MHYQDNYLSGLLKSMSNLELTEAKYSDAEAQFRELEAKVAELEEHERGWQEECQRLLRHIEDQNEGKSIT